eukprot:jgi/Undpi1/2780/HiC_scaffold_14.g06157.m1
MRMLAWVLDIGSHTVLLLLEAGYNVVVADNLVNSSEESLTRVRALTGCAPERLVFHNVDLCDAAALSKVLETCPTFHSCIHFAGLKAVGESVALPLLYYQNNIMSTLVLLEELGKTKCRSFVFSSSATVYGVSPSPITESSPVGDGITNPYGRTKFMIEEILKDFVKSEKGRDWAVECLRYFNPTGAHSSGDIGEDPNGIPNNLMPYVAQVAVGKRECLTVFGDKYDTKDGTGVRDYIHVVDLASGHLKALDFLEKKGCGWFTHNLGTGTGYSVLDMVAAMKKASGKDIPYKVGTPRPGDLACVYADPTKAAKELEWKAQFGLEEMMRDMWAWQSKNPDGFSSSSD